MHELSMAQSIMNAVIETSEKNHANKVIEVIIEIGKMTMLNSEQVIFMLEILSEEEENRLTHGANFTVEEIPVEIECLECGFDGKLENADLDPYTPISRCPKCGNFKVNVKNGKDIIVKNIVIDK
ncbi:MAG: hydrogenase maturation nickel metallochaperone HypA [Methanobrevibacter sp.]|jgi:hydrogenase nickel incorporation protein HypA/HybF|nr:hydrogenase maturation nickel metallochaperone HypA [Candidatus Methanovirga basalitermitum]